MIPVTIRSRLRDGARIHVVAAEGITHARHVLPFPVGACPVSRNPVGGTVTIEYEPDGETLEAVSLFDTLAFVLTKVSSVEAVATAVANEAWTALSHEAHVTVDVQLLPGPQTLTVRVGGGVGVAPLPCRGQGTE